MTATSVPVCVCVCASPWPQVSSSSEPSSGSTCCSSPEWSSTPEQCTQSYSSEGECTSHIHANFTETLKVEARWFILDLSFCLCGADLLSAAESPEQGNMRTLNSIVDSISAADGSVAFSMDIPK